MGAMKVALLCIIFVFSPVSFAYGQFKSTGIAGVKTQIDALLTSKAMTGTKVSVLVQSLDGQKTVYAATPDQALHPASNTKLVTTAVALEERFCVSMAD